MGDLPAQHRDLIIPSSTGGLPLSLRLLVLLIFRMKLINFVKLNMIGFIINLIEMVFLLVLWIMIELVLWKL